MTMAKSTESGQYAIAWFMSAIWKAIYQITIIWSHEKATLKKKTLENLR